MVEKHRASGRAVNGVDAEPMLDANSGYGMDGGPLQEDSRLGIEGPTTPFS